MESKDITFNILKLAFNAIKHFVEKSAWKGYFICAQQNNENISVELVEDIADYTYKKSPIKIIPSIKELLSNAGHSEGEIHKFVSDFVDLVKSRHPLLFLLFDIDSIKADFSKALDKINFEIDKIKSLPFYQLNYLTIDEYDYYLKQSSNKNYQGQVGLDLFDFKDNEFSNSFKDKISNNNPFLICGEYQRETLLAVLCELKNLFPDDYADRVYIFNNKSDYLKALNVSLHEEAILVNSFFDSDGIPTIRKYNNIHIVSKWKTKSAQLRLKPRLRLSTRSALERNGYSSEEMSKILLKCKNSFPHIFRELIKETDNYEERYITAIDINVLTTSLLVNRFSLGSVRDKDFIKELCGLNVDDYVEKLMPLTLEECPYAKKVVDFGHVEIEVIDFESSFDSFCDLLKPNIVNRFFELSKTALCGLPNSYSNNSSLSLNKEKDYSNSLLISILEILMFFTTKRKFKKQCFDLLSSFIDWIYQNNTIKHYEYLSDHLSLLVEIAPSLVNNNIHNDVLKRNGMCSLFLEKAGHNSFIFKGEKYTNILWALEKLLFIKSEREMAIRTLFDLYRLNQTYELSNSPKRSLLTFFAAWIKTTPVNEIEKTSLCEMLFEIDSKAAWNIFIELTYSGGGETLTPFYGPRYLKVDNFKFQFDDKEIFDRYKFYNEIILSNVKTPDQIVRIIKRHYFVYFGNKEVEKVISKIKEISTKVDDAGKRLIVDEIRSFVSNNRKFNDAGWAASSETVDMFEKLANEIHFERLELTYISLFTDYDLDIPDPEKYNYGNYDHELSERKKEKYFFDKYNEFIKNELDIDFLYNYFNNYGGAIQSRFFNFVKKYEIDYKKKTIFEFVNILLTKTPDSSIMFAFLGKDIYKNNKDLYYSIADILLKANSNNLLAYLYSGKIDCGQNSFKTYYEKLPPEMQIAFWLDLKVYVDIDYEDSLAVDFVLSNIAKTFADSTDPNPYLEILYYFHLHYKKEDAVDLVLKFLNVDPQILANSHITYLPYLIETLQNKYAFTEDTNIESRIAVLEMLSIRCNHNVKSICLNNILGRDPGVYFGFLESMYIRNDESKDYKGKLFSLLYFHLKFCPGYVHDIFKKDIFDSWVQTFKELVDKCPFDDKRWLYYSTLGKLFKYAKAENDLPMPIEMIEFIENNDDTDAFEIMKRYYCIEVNNSLGVRTISDGSDLLKKSYEFHDIRKKLEEKKFIKTASVFEELTEEFRRNAEIERKRAEDEW